MNLIRLAKKNPLIVIGTAAVAGLALGTGAFALPLPSRLSLAPRTPPPSSAPAATPPPPPDPLDAY